MKREKGNDEVRFFSATIAAYVSSASLSSQAGPD